MKKHLKPVKLERSLNLTLLVFYGLGTTIGAGIYVLIGAAAGKAGMYAPFAFILGAIGLLPTAMAYAELVGRFPLSAGEVVFTKEGLKIKWISNLVGWMVIFSGIIAAATIAIGCAGYISTFLNLPLSYLILCVILLMGLVAIWGIMESVLLAALFTIIEAGGLIVIIYFGFMSETVSIARIPEIIPPFSSAVIWIGIANAGMMAVFAFIGFEDMINVVEETKNPKKSMPRAIFLTLIITAILYTLVTIVAVFTIAPDELAQSDAPLSKVFQTLTNASPIYISVIAIFATANTILIQFIMVSRVIYGMANQRSLPSFFGKVNAKTQTPILATVAIMIATILLALSFSLDRLAEFTSQAILGIWTLVNLSLVNIKLKEKESPKDSFIVSIWVPIFGLLFCVAMIIVSLLG